MYLVAELETARGTATDQKCLVTTLAYSLYTSGPTGRGLAVVFLKSTPFQALLLPLRSRGYHMTHDFRDGFSVFSSHPDLVPLQGLFGKQALCPQSWWLMPELLPEHAQCPNRTALLAILLLWISPFLPVCLVPLFAGPPDIPGQNLTALWDCCYYNLFTSWSPFASVLGTPAHTHVSWNRHTLCRLSSPEHVGFFVT